MITVQIRLFSVLRDRLAADSIRLSVNDDASIRDVIGVLCGLHPEIAAYREYLRVAVNAAYAPESAPVRDGDELALITPVSGG